MKIKDIASGEIHTVRADKNIEIAEAPKTSTQIGFSRSELRSLSKTVRVGELKQGTEFLLWDSKTKLFWLSEIV